MRDGMIRDEINAANIITTGSVTAAVISGGTLAVASSQIDATELGSDSVDTAELVAGAVTAEESELIGSGSPPAWAHRILHGSAAMTAATSLWVVFGDVFATDTPDILTSCNKGGDIDVFSVSNGSFLASGTNATVFYWSAMGSA